MNKAGLRRIVSASFLFLASTASAVYAQSVSVPFPEGFIGTVGSSNNSATNIRIFSTLEIDRATFTQPSSTGQFTAQGNDIPGTLRLLLDDGTVIDVPGAINWRDTQGSTLHAFGFIPDPANPARTISYGSSNQFSMTLGSTSNYGLRIIGSSQTYSDGSSVSGNAATNGLLNALNSYLATVQASGPAITGPSGTAGATASAKTVNETQTAVATLTANRTVTWSIQGGTDAGKFTISSTTGALTFAAAPDFEAPSDSDANNTYVVTILATDANGYTGQQTVTVTVADLDEAAPFITGPSGMAGAAASAKSVIEGTTAVATLAANEPVTWSIVGGADQSKFTINASTGALTFVAAPDYETPSDSGTNNVYDLVVKAVDAASNASQQSVAVTVLDLDEVAPQITGPSGGAGAVASAKSVNEGTATVATFTADEGVTWSITGGADAGKFAVNPATGALTFLVAPDFETPADSGTNNVYDVVLTATDAANNTSTQAVAVTVLDLDDTAPVLTGPTTKSVPENQTAVDTYSADEPVTWIIVGGADATKFSIHPS
ncbi:cadherin repeat domain-containing protein, partial [Rubellimicrobium rubrum]